MSEKHLLAKIATLTLESQKQDKKIEAQAKKIEVQAKKIQAQNALIRQLRQRITSLINSRALLKAKYKQLQQTVQRCCGVHKSRHEFREPPIAGHKYDAKVVFMSLSLYFFGGCSLRGVRRVLLCFQLHYGCFSGDVPSKSSIDNWIQKVGYDDYTHLGTDTYEGDYAIIVDESMVVGQQRMMVVLGLPAAKTTAQASDLTTVRLLYLAVRASWKAPDVVKLLEDVTKKMGKAPLYVICDAGCNLIKGVKDAQLVRLCDVGHEIAKFIEQTYKHQDVFKAFSTAVVAVKFQEVMKDTAYLLPPKQRAIARFINLAHTVEWATKMTAALPKLTPKEQATFGFLRDYKSLIEELSDVFEMAHKMLKILKNEGISYQNIEKCTDLMHFYGLKMPTVLITKISTYLKKEKQKLPHKTTIWHASSDVIESLFGKFKQRAATNKLNGVTSLVLSLGLYGQFQNQNDQMQSKIKNALQDVSMADLSTWKKHYLIQNQVVRRKKMLKI
jgi:hypothetical protein